MLHSCESDTRAERDEKICYHKREEEEEAHSTKITVKYTNQVKITHICFCRKHWSVFSLKLFYFTFIFCTIGDWKCAKEVVPLTALKAHLQKMTNNKKIWETCIVSNKIIFKTNESDWTKRKLKEREKRKNKL